jgi:hypothetical protein
LLNTVREVLARATRHEKKKKASKLERKKLKKKNHCWPMTYVIYGHPKDFSKKYENRQFSKVASYKTNIQNLVALLYSNTNLSEGWRLGSSDRVPA